MLQKKKKCTVPQKWRTHFRTFILFFCNTLKSDEWKKMSQSSILCDYQKLGRMPPSARMKIYELNYSLIISCFPTPTRSIRSFLLWDNTMIEMFNLYSECGIVGKIRRGTKLIASGGLRLSLSVLIPSQVDLCVSRSVWVTAYADTFYGDV